MFNDDDENDDDFLLTDDFENCNTGNACIADPTFWPCENGTGC
jgi:hypothetical protein